MSLHAKVAVVVEGGDVRVVATEALGPEVLGYLHAIVRALPAPSGRSLPATRSEIGGVS